MKMTNIFGRNGSLIMAGALAFTFASCDTDTRSDQSTVREAENMYETETEQGVDINDPSLTYGEGDYETTETDNYDYTREYAYEDRDVVIDRVRNDLGRAEKSLQQVGQKIEREGEQASAEIKKEWEEARVNLEQKRQELNQDLEKLEKSTEGNWENVRNDANESLRGFEQEWNELKEKGFNYNEAETNLEDSENVRGVAPGTGTRDGEGF